jgi:nucleotide-binding universal stress UspA family protein
MEGNMFEKVLVALDFSSYSQKILDRVPEIPGIREIVLLHVVDATHPSRLGWTHGPHIENAKILLGEKKEALENLGLTVKINVDVIVNVITQGTIAQSILEIAETENVSLIVMGARGINPIQELLLGSVSSTVLRDAGMSVLIIRDTALLSTALSDRPLFSNVLVPTDFSMPINDVISVLKTLDGLKKVALLNVVSRVESKAEISEGVADAKTRLAALQKDFAAEGIMATPRVRIGDPTEMILSVAEEEDVSLIAMNAQGTDRLRSLILGSTTFTVVRRTIKPVLIVRTTGKKDEIG